MKPAKTKRNEKIPPAKTGKRPTELDLESSSGEGSASALASLRKMERNREQSKPPKDSVTDGD